MTRNPAFDGPDGIFADFEGMDSGPFIQSSGQKLEEEQDAEEARYDSEISSIERSLLRDLGK